MTDYEEVCKRIVGKLLDIPAYDMTEAEHDIAELLILHDVAEWYEKDGEKFLKVKEN